MKSIISTLAIFLVAAAISLNAQPRYGNGNGSGMQGIHPFITQHGSDLNLTEGQMKEIAELNLKFRQDFRANRTGNRGLRGQRGSFRDGRRGTLNSGWIDDRSEYHAMIMDILTDDQTQMLQSIIKERAENAHQFRTIQHELIVDEAGIEGEKRQNVLNLMNAHSEEMLEARMENVQSQRSYGDYRGAGFESRTELHNQLKELLTVAEYQNLQEVMGTPRAGYSDRSGRRGGNSRFNR